ncbi:MAG: tetratricopeptide repeat protein [Saprospiraceae bacterium]
MDIKIRHTLLSFIILISLSIISCGDDKKIEKKPTPLGNDLIVQLTKELDKNPKNKELLFNRANALYEINEYEASIKDLESAMRIDSLNPDYFHLLADNYLDYYRSREALATMHKVVQMYPTREASLLKLAEMQLILRQYENSISTVNAIIMKNPLSSEAYFMLGMNFRSMKDIDRAINSFQTAVEFDSELVDAWLILGELHEKKGTKDAIKYYNNAMTIAPNKSEVIHSKAFYLQNHGDIPGALKLYKSINIKDAQYVIAYLNAGILRLEQDSLDLAFEQFNILISIQPQNFLAYYYRGIIHKALNDNAKAKADFQNCLNINPKYKDAELALAKLIAQMDAQSKK